MKFLFREISSGIQIRVRSKLENVKLLCLAIALCLSCIQELLLWFQSDFDGFLDKFTKYLKKSLVVGDKQPAVERTLNFVAKFATTKKEEWDDEKGNEHETREEDEEEESEDPFLVNLILFLLHVSMRVVIYQYMIGFHFPMSFTLLLISATKHTFGQWVPSDACV